MGFRVVESATAIGTVRDLPADLATCDACVTEMFDPESRRFHYPFISCVACGPRATIMDEDGISREQTAMASFPMCGDCAREYVNPADRRFQTEQICCPQCGPQLGWVPAAPAWAVPIEYAEEALSVATGVIRDGGIVAVKGLGGYQLVCDATNETAIGLLRWRIHRPSRPFSVLATSLTHARRTLAWLDSEERTLLTSPGHPIVLAIARRNNGLASGVAPGTDQLGILLPHTPLQHLLVRELDRPLVVTSGSRSGEPIATDDHDAFDRLGRIVEGFLVHDRDVRARYDDSVVRAVDGRPAFVRRARGYAPTPLRLPRPAARPILAVGAQGKNTFALAVDGRAVLSPHIGDLQVPETFEAFEESLVQLSRLTGIAPQVVVHDLNPAYLTSQYAARWPEQSRLAVQHHHAHVASCAAEHGLTQSFIGVAYDDLGLGEDGTMWGGEILIADLLEYRRYARFGRAPLLGGDVAVRRPSRMALGYLWGAENLGSPPPDAELVEVFTDRLSESELHSMRRLVRRPMSAPYASSAGRLFDAVSGLLGLVDYATYEGEAAAVLEATARGAGAAELPWHLVEQGGLWVYDPVPTLTALLDGLASQEPVESLAAAFHATIVTVTVALCAKAAAETGLRTVCLSGGVFQNRLVTTDLLKALQSEGFDAFVNQDVPPNDGGIAYGQAAIAAARL
jgi:hydrogenase maturation protein HypF